MNIFEAQFWEKPMFLKVSKSMLVVCLFCLATPAMALTIKLATVAPENSAWMQDMRKAAKAIKEQTDGRVQIKLYGGGVMGNDASMLRKMRIGQLHGGAFVSGALTSLVPDLYVYGLPLLFNSQEEVDYVRRRMDQELLDQLESKGMVAFGFAGAGFAQFMSGSPIRTLEDIKGQKVWVPEGDQVSYAAMESLGLSPVTLPMTDVLTGLQTGLIDIIASSPVGAVVFQWHTKVKYVTQTPLVYVIALTVIDRRTFKKMSPEDQAVVRKVMGSLNDNFDRQSIVDNKSALKALLANGVQQIDPAPGDEQRWRQQTDEVIDQMASDGLFGSNALARVRQLISEYRQEQAQASVD